MTDAPLGEVSSEEALDAFYAALLDDDPVQLYERAPCGYLSTTPDGTIVKVNGTFLTQTGFERADLIGRKRFADLLSVGGRIYHETHYAPMLRMEGSAREIALEIVRPDGSRLPVLVNSVLERDSAGTPAVIRTAVFDATDRRSYEQELLRAKQRAEESEARASLLARTLQQTLIPPAPPVIPGLDVAAVYRPAGDGSEVGGDFFDVFEVGADDWVVVVGDVCGKGAEAAVVTALARYTIRGAAVRLAQPSQMLGSVNEMVLRDGTDRFCTAVAMRLRLGREGWVATICAAGHPLPLLARNGEVVPVGRLGKFLGVFEDAQLRDAQVLLQPGDTVTLYTDGVTEARVADRFYGTTRLESFLARGHASAGALTTELVDDVLAFQDGDARDDVAVVAVRLP